MCRLLILLGNLICSCTSLHKFKHNTKPTKLILHSSAHLYSSLKQPNTVQKHLVTQKKRKKNVFRKQVFIEGQLKYPRSELHRIWSCIQSLCFKKLSYNRKLSFLFKISTNTNKTKPSLVYFYYHWFALHLFNTTQSI